jgi:vitamin B12 transporter
LILVNGNPVSWRGKYNLEAIAVDNIERVEIVKSGGSVLYGSEAMGGVINIILKKNGANTVGIGFGKIIRHKLEMTNLM